MIEVFLCINELTATFFMIYLLSRVLIFNVFDDVFCALNDALCYWYPHVKCYDATTLQTIANLLYQYISILSTVVDCVVLKLDCAIYVSQMNFFLSQSCYLDISYVVHISDVLLIPQLWYPHLNYVIYLCFCVKIFGHYFAFV